PSTIQNNGGTVKADSGGTLDLTNVTIFGGLLTGTGTIATVGNGSESYFDGTASALSIGSGTTVTVNDQTTLDLTGTITNAGKIDAASGGTIELDGVTIKGGTLGGTGTIETKAGSSDSTFDGSGAGGFTIANGTEITVTAGTKLDLTGTIYNDAAINVDANSNPAPAELTISSSVVLKGYGTITLDPGDSIVSNGTAATLENFNNTISGAGAIGNSGDTLLTLKNDAAGIIDANVNGETLTIDTGNTVTNNGTLEATNGGTLKIVDDVTGSGHAEVSTGGMLDILGSDPQPVIFNDASTLKLEATSSFTGDVSGLSVGDIIDLSGITVTSATFSGSTLTVNGTTATFTISGLTSADAFYFTSDGTGGTNFTFETAPTITIGAIAADNVVNSSEAAAGFTIGGTASDASVDVNGQFITIDIVNASNVVVDTFTT
ncbi:MAG: beta strand repeat-containing protein, partial [Terriglobia bacterium]